MATGSHSVVGLRPPAGELLDKPATPNPLQEFSERLDAVQAGFAALSTLVASKQRIGGGVLLGVVVVGAIAGVWLWRDSVHAEAIRDHAHVQQHDEVLEKLTTMHTLITATQTEIGTMRKVVDGLKSNQKIMRGDQVRLQDALNAMYELSLGKDKARPQKLRQLFPDQVSHASP
jgi:hypothetical protein